MAKKFQPGWLINIAMGARIWPFAAGGRPWDGELFIDMAPTPERACLDDIMTEDAPMISESDGGASEVYLKRHIQGPVNDPAPPAAPLAYSTSKIGVATPLSPLGHPPFLLARLCATLGNIAHGRFGWNIIEIGEGLVPAWQRHGVVRIQNTQPTPRQTLREF